MAKKILIIEDNDLNRKLLNDVLQFHDYETMQAINEPSALALVRENRPDLIVMDVQLAAMANLDAARRVKDALREVPLIAVTASALDGDEERIRAGGCDACLSKPISVRGFLKTVEDFLA